MWAMSPAGSGLRARSLRGCCRRGRARVGHRPGLPGRQSGCGDGPLLSRWRCPSLGASRHRRREQGSPARLEGTWEQPEGWSGPVGSCSPVQQERSKPFPAHKDRPAAEERRTSAQRHRGRHPRGTGRAFILRWFLDPPAAVRKRPSRRSGRRSLDAWLARPSPEINGYRASVRSPGVAWRPGRPPRPRERPRCSPTRTRSGMPSR